MFCFDGPHAATFRLSFPNATWYTLTTEQLQLVHYDVGQEYTAHHDFGYVTEVDEQDARFATLLLYLNEVPKGGETSFPRWSNAETFKELKVAPDTPGKAVLFYSQVSSFLLLFAGVVCRLCRF